MGPLESKVDPGMRPIDELLKAETERDRDYSGPGVRPGRLMVRRRTQRTQGGQGRAWLLCARVDWGAERSSLSHTCQGESVTDGCSCDQQWSE
jgi:hypothetical protein